MAIPAANLAIELGSDKARHVLCKALQHIQENWDLSNVDMSRLLHIKPNTYGNWLKQNEVPVGVAPYAPEIEIVIALIAIYRSLGAMFAASQDQILWLRQKHPDLGESPMTFVQKACANVFWLRAYLDYVRGCGA